MLKESDKIADNADSKKLSEGGREEEVGWGRGVSCALLWGGAVGRLPFDPLNKRTTTTTATQQQRQQQRLFFFLISFSFISDVD